jgi:hypothetical protein
VQLQASSTDSRREPIVGSATAWRSCLIAVAPELGSWRCRLFEDRLGEAVAARVGSPM